jgi:hypothetical protein
MPTRNIYSQLPESVLVSHKGYWIVDFSGPRFVGGPFRAIFTGAQHVDALYAEVLAYLGGEWDGLAYFRAYLCSDPEAGDVQLFEYRKDNRFHAASLTSIGVTEYEKAVLLQLAKGTRDHTGATLIRRAIKAMCGPGGNSPDRDDHFNTAAPHEAHLSRVLSNYRRHRVLPEKPLFLKVRGVTRGSEGEFAATTYEVPQGFRKQQGDMKKMTAQNIEPSWASAEQYEDKPIELILGEDKQYKMYRINLTVVDDAGARELCFGTHDYMAASEQDALRQARMDADYCVDRLLQLVSGTKQ